ncbi:hypothetical protein AVEN_33452-1 [Araneus ventricosus]|uniref:Uncharacterized protein n=1 Tax=Araneus ventricosus TaxID=182803 RepID=A0A4Y2V602_ARAVE|nr:hypothetical protein AVEN_33452-1 [Araneus ventricosus]
MGLSTHFATESRMTLSQVPEWEEIGRTPAYLQEENAVIQKEHTEFCTSLVVNSILNAAQPRRTRLRRLWGTSESSSELVTSEWDAEEMSLHRGEQRYWSRGMRYLPQKSTNLMCSTRTSK